MFAIGGAGRWRENRCRFCSNAIYHLCLINVGSQGVLHRHGDHCGGERLDRGNTSETGVWWGGRCKDNDVEHISNTTSQNGSSCSSMQSKFSMFFLRGYAGWGGRQLDEEVWRGSWHVTKTLGESGGPSAHDLFTLDGRAQWVDLWKRFLDHPAPPPPGDEHGIYEHNRDDFRTEVSLGRLLIRQ